MRIRPPSTPLIASLIALALFGAACGSTDTDVSDPGEAADPGVAVDPAATFNLVAYQGEDLLGGEEISFDSLLGHGTPVILNFWAAQCPPCLLEMPWFETAWQEHGDDVLLVGVDVGPFTGLGSNEQGEQLLEDLEITYPTGYAVDDQPLRQLNVTNMPFTVFFDADGAIVDSHGGILTEAQIQDRFADLAAGAG